MMNMPIVVGNVDEEIGEAEEAEVEDIDAAEDELMGGTHEIQTEDAAPVYFIEGLKAKELAPAPEPKEGEEM